MKLTAATAADAPAIAALRNAAADDLMARYSRGLSPARCTERSVLFDLRHSSVYTARRHDRIIATLVLGTRKPWAIDRSYFTPCARPLYLTAMAVAPDYQRQGIGRLCLAEAARIARAFPAQAIFLDAYDNASGAGGFYRKCGYRETGRATFRSAPLIYFELLL